MKKYIPINLGFDKGDVLSLVNNFKAISTSILDIISKVNSNEKRVVVIENKTIATFTTALRPTKTETTVFWGINTTTNKINHTRDGGTTWYNADGTGA